MQTRFQPSPRVSLLYLGDKSKLDWQSSPRVKTSWSRGKKQSRKEGRVPEYCLRLFKRVKQTYKWYLRGKVVGGVEEDVDAGININMSDSTSLTRIFHSWLGFPNLTRIFQALTRISKLDSDFNPWLGFQPLTRIFQALTRIFHPWLGFSTLTRIFPALTRISTLDSDFPSLDSDLTPGDDAEVESPSHFSHPGSADDVRWWRQR